ncbi:MAPEG family protein [Paraglaciecola sp. 2405UD69-4]|uniref:MAPEG family protein n=1 Tax=Paraglaciecola sp. 2405UD69-4 TaxID=3391836 RepID=UPI0039C8F457
MNHLELIAVLAVNQYLFFGAMTGKARRVSGLEAPAIQGAIRFERMYRVQMNTLEMLAAFLPLLFIAGRYQQPIVISLLGSVYLLGRFVYWRAYVTEPATRTLGFMLTLVPIVLLSIVAMFGIFRSLL